jgi:hypothetical protein
MKGLKHPATVIALLALFVALTGTAYASGLISGRQIKNHSIPAKKLTKSAVRSLHGQRGPAGTPGATGPKGDPGPKGDTGPQGPGGAIVTYDATASATPTIKTLGTILGDTIGASCSTTAGDAELHVWFKTSDGSWAFDNSFVSADDATTFENASSVNAPAGSYSTSTNVVSYSAAAGVHTYNIHLVFIQLAPTPGSMVWHATASTDNAVQTCHMSVQTFPETKTTAAGLPHQTQSATDAPAALGDR